jgi:hypothetical protein
MNNNNYECLGSDRRHIQGALFTDSYLDWWPFLLFTMVIVPMSLTPTCTDLLSSSSYLTALYYSFNQLKSDLKSLKYVLPVSKYIRSLFALDLSSNKFRKAAVKQLEFSNLPWNSFTIQTLLPTTIAAFNSANWLQPPLVSLSIL